MGGGVDELNNAKSKDDAAYAEAKETKTLEGDDWCIECSDEEIGEVDPLYGNFWHPDPKDIVELLQRMTENPVLELEWKCPPRRPPTPDEPEPERMETDVKEDDKPEEPTEFDFDEFDDDADDTPITPRRTPGGSRLKSNQKRVASLSRVLGDIARYKRIDEQQMRKKTADSQEKEKPLPGRNEMTVTSSEQKNIVTVLDVPLGSKESPQNPQSFTERLSPRVASARVTTESHHLPNEHRTADRAIERSASLEGDQKVDIINQRPFVGHSSPRQYSAHSLRQSGSQSPRQSSGQYSDNHTLDLAAGHSPRQSGGHSPRQSGLQGPQSPRQLGLQSPHSPRLSGHQSPRHSSNQSAQSVDHTSHHYVEHSGHKSGNQSPRQSGRRSPRAELGSSRQYIAHSPSGQSPRQMLEFPMRQYGGHSRLQMGLPDEMHQAAMHSLKSGQNTYGSSAHLPSSQPQLGHSPVRNQSPGSMSPRQAGLSPSHSSSISPRGSPRLGRSLSPRQIPACASNVANRQTGMSAESLAAERIRYEMIEMHKRQTGALQQHPPPLDNDPYAF